MIIIKINVYYPFHYPSKKRLESCPLLSSVLTKEGSGHPPLGKSVRCLRVQ